MLEHHEKPRLFISSFINYISTNVQLDKGQKVLSKIVVTVVSITTK